MSIIYKSEIDSYEKLNTLYDDAHKALAFKNSTYKRFAFDGDKLIGAIRVISEGVETALLVDAYVTPEYDSKIKEELLKGIEDELGRKRVMVYGKRSDLDFFEAQGYGRCKNAWSYFLNPESAGVDFLPKGYQYEGEQEKRQGKSLSSPKKEITYTLGLENASYDAINDILTKAFFNRPHDINNTTKAFHQSQYVISAFDGEKLVGVARAVSDLVEYATILNVAVDPDYQGYRIGKNLVLKLSEAIKEKTIVLNTHPGAVGFYNGLDNFRRNKYVYEKALGQTGGGNPAFHGLMFTEKGFRFEDEK